LIVCDLSKYLFYIFWRRFGSLRSSRSEGVLSVFGSSISQRLLGSISLYLASFLRMRHPVNRCLTVVAVLHEVHIRCSFLLIKFSWVYNEWPIRNLLSMIWCLCGSDVSCIEVYGFISLSLLFCTYFHSWWHIWFRLVCIWCFISKWVFISLWTISNHELDVQNFILFLTSFTILLFGGCCFFVC